MKPSKQPSKLAMITKLRNHKIMRLRGIWASALTLITDQTNLEEIQAAVDDELERVGAEREAYRRFRIRKELNDAYELSRKGIK